MRSSIIAIVAIAALAFGAFYPKPNTQEKEEMIMLALTSVLNQGHFRPAEINDDFSNIAFDNYLVALDGNKRFLTQLEVDQLEAFRLEIDNQIKERSFELFDASIDLMDKSVNRAEKIFKNIIKEEFDFDQEEYLELDGDKRSFAKDESALKDFWRRSVKYEILSRIEEANAAQEKNDTLAAEDLKTFDELEQEAREDVDELFKSLFKRLEKVRRSDRFEVYLNTITHINDPHSDYYNPKEKQDFDINMGGKLEGIGARLQTSGDFTKIVDIIPGGPAWKGKELQVDDIITKVRQDGEELPLDITGMRIDDVVQKIRGKKGTKVILTIKKADGSFKEIEIVRDLVVIEDGNARSVLLEMDQEDDKASYELGYIYLPKFYDDFEAKDGRSCAEHVRIELEKLKQENVDGIILDLRNNGGGSLRDVVTMSGLFIEEGPIVQVKPRDFKAYVLKDEDSSVTYDGPLIVMVNKYSASASEILAAALQDYDRALIVGSASTFGKGTVQRFFDLDRAIRGNNDLKPLGQVKITTQKFYRINGGSTQLKGVEPDIILPDVYQYLETGEQSYDHPIEWSEIEPVEYNQMVYHVEGEDKLMMNSKERIASNPTFQLIEENAKRIKSNSDETNFPLSFKAFDAKMDAFEAESEKYKDLYEREIEGLNISMMDQDMAKIQIDSSRIARNDRWIEGLQKDLYLEETIQIMYDMINQEKS